MAFVKINKSSVGSSTNLKTPIIRMGSHRQSEKQASRGIYFTVNPKVVELVGWELRMQETTKKEGSRAIVNVSINEGTYEDAGFIMLAEDPMGYALGSNRAIGDVARHSLAMSISISRIQHYVLNDVTVDIEPEDVEFTIDEKEHTILIQCPDWLRYNPLSLPEKEEAPPTPVKAEPPRPLNREERRRLVSKVASTLRR